MAKFTLGDLIWRITGETGDFDKKVDTSGKKAEGLGGKLKKLSVVDLAKAAFAFVAASRVIQGFIRELGRSADAAAKAQEVQSKFNAVFGENARETRKWAEEYSSSIGRNQTETEGFLATLQDTFVPLGFAREEAGEFSKTLVELANDLASFNNLPTADVVRDLQSALVGNTQVLRKYGVVANEAAIIQEAINSGLVTSASEIDAQVKAQAILQITLKGTADAQGDLLRTQESAANVSKRLESSIESLREETGKVVLEGLTPLRSALASFVQQIADSTKETNRFRQIIENLRDGTVDQTLAIDDYRTALARLAEEEALVLSQAGEQRGEARLRQIREQIRQTQALIIEFERQAIAQSIANGFTRQGAENARRQESATRILTVAVAELEQQRLDSLSPQEKELELIQARINELKIQREEVEATRGVESYSAETLRRLWDQLIERRRLLRIEIAGTTEDVDSEAGAVSELAEAYDDVASALQTAIFQQEMWNQESEKAAQALIKSRNNLSEFADIYSATFASMIDQTQGLANAISSIFTAMGEREIESINATREARLESIDKQIEAAKQEGENYDELTDRRAEIDEEYDDKISAIKRRQAMRNKQLGIFNAGIDTASAIIRFLADPGGLAGIVLSALAGATGAAQIAAIAAQPIPAFAKGGDFTTNGPQLMLVGDNPGGRERVSVEPLSSPNINGPDGSPLYVQINLDGQVMSKFVTKAIRNNRILVDARALV